MLKVAIISDGPDIFTGFANQARLLAKGLANKNYFVEYIGWFSKVTEYDGYKVYPISSLDKRKDVSNILLNNRYDAIIALGDLPYVYFIYKDLDDDIKNRTLLWLPIDHVPYHLADHIIEIPNLVLMSKFAYDYIKEQVKHNNITLIPHGVELDKFFRYDDGYINRLKECNGVLNKFVIGDNFRNSARKRPDLLLQIWNEFSKDKDDVLLIIHTDVRDPMGLPLDYLINNIYKIPASKVKISRTTARQGVDETYLNFLYNTWDLRLSTSSGEGFGICTLEAMACGVPSLLPNHTSSVDLMPSDYLIDCSHTLVDRAGCIRKLVSIDDSIKKLNYYYSLYKSGMLEKKLNRNYFIGKAKEYNIKDVIDKWDRLVKSVIASLPKAISSSNTFSPNALSLSDAKLKMELI